VRALATTALIAALGGCGDTATTGAADSSTVPRCVATGVADGSWLTAEWDERVSAPDCSGVRGPLRDPATPGRYVAGATIGELRCEGLRPGPAMLRVRMRVRMLTSGSADMSACHCLSTWVVGMRVVVDGAETRSLDGLTGGPGDDASCVRGPDVTQTIGVNVGPDGRVHAQVELGRCDRPTATSCVFLRGTGLSVEQ
jgi:hypothetical protein